MPNRPELTALTDRELEAAAADAARRLAAINSELRERRVLQAAEGRAGRCSTCEE